MRIVKAIFPLVLTFGPAAAEECVVCDPEIVMTPALVSCFLEQADLRLSEMQQQNLPFVLINLGTCSTVNGPSRGVDPSADSSRQIFSWGDIRNARTNTPTTPTTTFIMDRAGLICLETLIRANPGGFNPAAAIRPAEMCPQ